MLLVVILLVLVVCKGERNKKFPYQIPHLKVSGSHYECLFTASQHFKDKIVNFVENYDVLHKTLVPWYDNNTELYESFVTVLKTQFPQYLDEIQGIADGSGVDFYKIMLMNMRMEIESLLSLHGEEEGDEEMVANECTDIHVRNMNDNIYIMGHNEDGDPSIYENSFIVDFDIDDDVRFTAFNYPGIIPGNAFNWNEYGLVFGGNALTPVEVLAPGIPRMVLYRHSVSAKTIDESISNIASVSNRAFGVSINVGSIHTKRQVNYEFSSSYFGVVEIRTVNYSHMNNYKYLDVPYHNSVSTVHRQARIDEFSVPKTIDDVRMILGDTKDPKFPVYNKDTLSTAIFDIVNMDVMLYSSNPKTSEPLYHWSLLYKDD